MELRDPHTFERAYAEHVPRVTAAARRILGDPGQANDVAQDVFLRLWRDPACFDPARGDLGPFLDRMARNRALDLVRTTAARARAGERLTALAEREPARVEDVPAAAAERAADQAAVRAALHLLPDVQRRALVLAYWGGLPAHDVADATGAPVGTAKSRIRLGLRRLATHVA
jgi:RNA polymerase sigma-70 factor (ECF subfamily)